MRSFDFILTTPQGVPRGVVTLETVKAAMAVGLGDKLLDTQISTPVQNLQAEWPLRIYARGFRKQETLHPVLYNDRIVGVLDTRAFWEILKGRNRSV